MIGLINNSITSSLSVILIISHLDKKNMGEYWQLLLMLIMFDLSVSYFFRPSLLFRFLFVGGNLYLKCHEPGKSLLLSMAAEAIILAEILLISPVFYQLSREQLQSDLLQILIGTYIVVINSVFKTGFFKSKASITTLGDTKTSIRILAMALGTPFLFSRTINIKGGEWGGQLIFVAYGSYILIILKLIYDICRKRLAAIDLHEDKEAAMTIAKSMDKRYLQVLEIRHYYQKLYTALELSIRTNNMDEVEALFEKHFRPIHIKMLEDGTEELLCLIESLLLRNLLYEAVVRSRAANIKLILYISSYIKVKGIDELHLFIVISEFIDNAIEAVTSQADGTIIIDFHQSREGCRIYIENSCDSQPDITRIGEKGYTTKTQHRGLGLAIVADILAEYPHIEHFCYLWLGNFIQELYIGGLNQDGNLDNG